MTTPPLKPTKTLADVIARFKANLDKQAAPLPKPLTDDVPKPWSDTDNQQDDGGTT